MSRILFMGTPDFACVSLEALYEAGHEICAVITRADKPKNRGMQLTPPPAKELALSRGTPVYQPTTLRDGAAAAYIRGMAPELIVVVAYGKILPKEILDIPPHGCINVHPSLLPKYQGAAPIQWAILNGDETTGVSIMQMDEALDTGDVLAQEETEIGPNETAGQLFERLSIQGAKLLIDTIPAVTAGEIKGIPQDPELATYAKPIRRELSPVDWTRSVSEILCQIRGLIPWPMATTEIAAKVFKLHAAQAGRGDPGAPPGTVLSANEAGLEIACGDGSVIITRLQPPGKKPMAAADYLRGNPIA